MDELEQQIKAWADASAPGPEGALAAAQVIEGSARTEPQSAPVARPWARIVAVAAAVLLIAGAAVTAVVVARDDRDQVRATDPIATSTAVPTSTDPSAPTASSTTADPTPTGEVAFDVLSQGKADRDQMGTLRYASSIGTLLPLWSDSGHRLPLPDVDFDRQVVVSITIPDDACPPELSGFKRTGSTLEPRFVEPQGGCIEPLVPKTYVVALDRSTTGPAFHLFLPGQPTYDFDDQDLAIDLVTEPPVSATLSLDATTVNEGGKVKGTITLVNDSGKELTASGCGSYFSVTLESPAYRQRFAHTLCLQEFTFPEGRSTYPVTLWASYTACSTATGEVPVGEVRCVGDGQPPPLPKGKYLATVQQQGTIVDPPDPIEVTIR